MSRSGFRLGRIGFALALVGCAAAAVAAVATAITRATRLPVTSTQVPPPQMPDRSAPIRAEADVFRTHAGVLAIPPEAPRLRNAHPRTLARYRFVRAFPGAPPRIPHGFTADEFRTGACNTCHLRGGYSPRFGAYVPITPHPDQPACLQCHVGRDEVTGVALPNLDPNTVCAQCHWPGAAAWSVEGLVNWEPMSWPDVIGDTSGTPPPMPHDGFFRENCNACHSGPSAVREIRTSHPEWTACRQCHVTIDPAVPEFGRSRSEPR